MPCHSRARTGGDPGGTTALHGRIGPLLPRVETHRSGPEPPNLTPKAVVVSKAGGGTAAKYSNHRDPRRPPPALSDRPTCLADLSDHRAHSSHREGQGLAAPQQSDSRDVSGPRCMVTRVKSPWIKRSGSWLVAWVVTTLAFWLLGKVTDEPRGWAESATFALLSMVFGELGPRWRRYRRSRKPVRTRSASASD